MPLPEPQARRTIHSRVIDMTAYERVDGLYDIEAHLVDTKPFTFTRVSSPVPLSAGRPLHEMWVRLTVDIDYVVRDIQAVSDATPWGICKEAESTLSVLVGERIERGWSGKVKERLRGAAGCTHLSELLLPLASAALQGIRAVHPARLAGTIDPSPKVDSCYAYAAEREVVRLFWPPPQKPPGA